MTKVSSEKINVYNKALPAKLSCLFNRPEYSDKYLIIPDKEPPPPKVEANEASVKKLPISPNPSGPWITDICFMINKTANNLLKYATPVKLATLNHFTYLKPLNNLLQ